MRALVVALLGLLFASCTKCGTSGVVDAGPVRMPSAKRSVDFRTAVILVYPEYRGTAVLKTTATVTRTIPGLTPALRDEALKKLRFGPAEDGGWNNNVFHVSQLSDDVLAVSLDYSPDQLAHLYIAPTGLTSTELALYLPRELPIGRETLTFEVEYSSSPERSRELVYQAVRLLLANSQWVSTEVPPEWADGGFGEHERVVLLGTDSAVISYERTGGRVKAKYTLETR